MKKCCKGCDYEDLFKLAEENALEIAFLKEQHASMIEAMGELIKAGNEMYDLAVRSTNNLGTSKEFKEWDDLTSRY